MLELYHFVDYGQYIIISIVIIFIIIIIIVTYQWLV